MHPKIRRISNKVRSLDKRKLSVLLMAIAFLSALVSIDVEEHSHTVEGDFIRQGENESYNQYIVTLPKFLDETDNVLYLRYQTNTTENSTVRVKDYEGDILLNITLIPGEGKNLSIPDDSYYLTAILDQGRVFYRYKVDYYQQPYSFLAIPAFILTIIGVYLFLQGQMERRVKKKLENMEESKEKDI